MSTKLSTLRQSRHAEWREAEHARRLSFIDTLTLVGKITLPDGTEGTIHGHGDDFATFTDADGYSCEYSWQTIQRFREAGR